MIKTYNIFLFLSTFTRGLVSVYSLVLLYKIGYSTNNLLFFLFINYTFGILVNYISLKLNYKLVLILSSIIYSLSFIYLSKINGSIISLSIFSILLSFASYSYHSVRHLLALLMINDKKRSGSKIVLINYIGVIASTIIGMLILDRLSLTIISIIILILSFISIIPILKIRMINIPKCNERVVISKRRVIFNILEQFKVIFLELQPLFLYIYIDSSLSYVGIFNVLTSIASLIVVYFIRGKLILKHFKYYVSILSLIFLLKINIKSSIMLLIIALLEGIFTKIYESFSLDSMYNYKGNIRGYLIKEETIFFVSKSIIMFLFLMLRLNIYIIMYINILGIFISGFFMNSLKENT